MTGLIGERCVISGKKAICHHFLKDRGSSSIRKWEEISGSTKKKKGNGDSHLCNLHELAIAIFSS